MSSAAEQLAGILSQLYTYCITNPTWGRAERESLDLLNHEWMCYIFLEHLFPNSIINSMHLMKTI